MFLLIPKRFRKKKRKKNENRFNKCTKFFALCVPYLASCLTCERLDELDHWEKYYGKTLVLDGEIECLGEYSGTIDTERLQNRVEDESSTEDEAEEDLTDVKQSSSRCDPPSPEFQDLSNDKPSSPRCDSLSPEFRGCPTPLAGNLFNLKEFQSNSNVLDHNKAGNTKIGVVDQSVLSISPLMKDVDYLGKPKKSLPQIKRIKNEEHVIARIFPDRPLTPLPADNFDHKTFMEKYSDGEISAVLNAEESSQVGNHTVTVETTGDDSKLSNTSSDMLQTIDLLLDEIGDTSTTKKHKGKNRKNASKEASSKQPPEIIVVLPNGKDDTRSASNPTGFKDEIKLPDVEAADKSSKNTSKTYDINSTKNATGRNNAVAKSEISHLCDFEKTDVKDSRCASHTVDTPFRIKRCSPSGADDAITHKSSSLRLPKINVQGIRNYSSNSYSQEAADDGSSKRQDSELEVKETSNKEGDENPSSQLCKSLIIQPTVENDISHHIQDDGEYSDDNDHQRSYTSDSASSLSDVSSLTSSQRNSSEAKYDSEHRIDRNSQMSGGSSSTADSSDDDSVDEECLDLMYMQMIMEYMKNLAQNDESQEDEEVEQRLTSISRHLCGEVIVEAVQELQEEEEIAKNFSVSAISNAAFKHGDGNNSN